jgi:hypothetical protein
MAENVTHEPRPQPGPAPRKGFFRRILALLKDLLVRGYALAILLVVLWAGYAAVAYLVRTVFAPAHVPEEYRTWETALPGAHPDALHLQELAGLVPRAPIGHYHAVDRALPPDLHNGCLTSGCHNALAHSQRKEIRAFANLHATFLDCGMCHDASISGPTPAMWVDDATGEPCDAPAVLQLMKFLALEAGQIKDQPAEAHPTIESLLGDAAGRSADPLLKYLYAQIRTSQPGSPVWRKTVEQLRDELPNHVRGDYGAKLARRKPAEERKAYHRRLVELAQPYLESPKGSPERKRLHEEIHKGILEKPSACSTCHGDEPARLDFEALGYSPDQAAALRDSAIARQMEQIQKGQPFYLPELLEGGNERR